MSRSNFNVKTDLDKSYVDRAREDFEMIKIVTIGDNEKIGVFVYQGKSGHKQGLIVGNVEMIESCFKAMLDSRGMPPRFVNNLTYKDSTKFTGHLFELTDKNQNIIANALDSLMIGKEYPCGSEVVFSVHDGNVKLMDGNKGIDALGKVGIATYIIDFLDTRTDFENFSFKFGGETYTKESTPLKFYKSSLRDTLMSIVSEFERKQQNFELTLKWGIAGVCRRTKDGDYIPNPRQIKSTRQKLPSEEEYLEMIRMRKEEESKTQEYINSFTNIEDRSRSSPSAMSQSRPARSSSPVLMYSNNETINFIKSRQNKSTERSVTRPPNPGKMNKRKTINGVLVPFEKEEDLNLGDSCTVEYGNTCGVRTVNSYDQKTTRCGLCGCHGHSQDRCTCPFCKLINAHNPKDCPLIDARYRSAESIGLKSSFSLGGVDPESRKNTEARFLINLRTRQYTNVYPIAVGQLGDMEILQQKYKADGHETIILQNLHDLIVNEKLFDTDDIDGCISPKFRMQLKEVFNSRVRPGSLEDHKPRSIVEQNTFRERVYRNSRTPTRQDFRSRNDEQNMNAPVRQERIREEMEMESSVAKKLFESDSRGSSWQRASSHAPSLRESSRFDKQYMGPVEERGQMESNIEKKLFENESRGSSWQRASSQASPPSLYKRSERTSRGRDSDDDAEEISRYEKSQSYEPERQKLDSRRSGTVSLHAVDVEHVNPRYAPFMQRRREQPPMNSFASSNTGASNYSRSSPFLEAMGH